MAVTNFNDAVNMLTDAESFKVRERLCAIIIKKLCDTREDRCLLLAICRHESHFRPTAINNTGGDAKRGGAYGLAQMTFKTAQALGYKGIPTGLLDIRTNLDLAQKLIEQSWLRTKYVKNVISIYNSGKMFFRAPETTQTAYVPNVLSYYEDYLKKYQEGLFD